MRQFAWLALLAAFFAQPASADRYYISPAHFAWTAASGPVSSYEVQAFEADAWPTIATVPAATLTLAAPIAASMQLRVRALDAAGASGPWSDASEAFRLYPNADFDGDGRVGGGDVATAASLFGQRNCHGEYLRTCP